MKRVLSLCCALALLLALASCGSREPEPSGSPAPEPTSAVTPTPESSPTPDPVSYTHLSGTCPSSTR